MIELSNLRLRHFTEGRLSLHIDKGEIIGLAGKNGAGKTTLLRYLAGLETAGEIINEIETDLFFHPAESFRTALVFQHAEDNLIFSTLREDVSFGLKNTGKTLSSEAFRDLLDIFNLKEKADFPYRTMSSGERERAALLSIISQEPDLLLLDEPLSMQSKEPACRILEQVLQNARARGITVICASHEPELLNLCSRIIRMEKGTAAEDSAAVPDQTLTKSPFNQLLDLCGITCGEVSDFCGTGPLRLSQYSLNEPGGSCLELDCVHFRRPEKTVFSDLSLNFKKGDLVHLTGPSGSGKSTLLQLTAGLLRAQAGEVRAFGKPFPREGKGGWSSIGKVDHQAYLNSIRARIGYAGQHPDRQLWCSTVFEEVGFAPGNFGLSGESLHAAQVKALYQMEIPESFWQRNTAQLSVGEQRKVSLAGVIASEPQLLLLDDPYAELDQNGIETLNRMIREQLEQGHTAVIAEGS